MFMNVFIIDIRASSQENLILLHVNNKGTDQALLFTIMNVKCQKLVTCKVTIFWLVSIDEQAA